MEQNETTKRLQVNDIEQQNALQARLEKKKQKKAANANEQCTSIRNDIVHRQN